MAAQAADLVQSGASVIVMILQFEALAAKVATQAIPINFMTSTDPVEIGLVKSHMFTLGHVAEMLGEDEEWLFEVAEEMDPEVGQLWVVGVGEDGVMAFTEDGIENLKELIVIHKEGPSIIEKRRQLLGAMMKPKTEESKEVAPRDVNACSSGPIECDSHHSAARVRLLCSHCLQQWRHQHEGSTTMFRSTLIISAAIAVALGASSAAFAKPPHGKGFSIYDQNGNELFNDGKLDGKGCVIGKKAVFDPKTGGLKVVNAAKCNF